MRNLINVFSRPLFLLTIIMINSEEKSTVVATGHEVFEQSSQKGGYGNSGGYNDDSSSPANYMFEYGIDDHYGPMLSHNEEKNGQETRGRYSVLLPDGRLQIVNYSANKNGYKAEVTYQPSTSSNYGSGGSNNGGYENVQTSASSYGQQSPPPSKKSNGGNRGNGGNARTYVKFRRNDKGRTFAYAY